MDKLSINENGEPQGDQVQILNLLTQGDQVQILNLFTQIALKLEKIFVNSHYVKSHKLQFK